MRVVSEYDTFIHTQFVTDGLSLQSDDADRIITKLSQLLRTLRIVAPAHLERSQTIDVVLHCKPLKSDLEAIRRGLGEILEPIPIQPAVVKQVSAGPYR